MKICLVNNLYLPVAEGGTEVVVKQIIHILHDHGHEVVLITTQPEVPAGQPWVVEKTTEATIYRFRPHNLYYYTAGAKKPWWLKLLWHAWDMVNPFDAATLRQIIQREHPDLVHGHNLKGMSYTLPEVCANLKIPYVHTLHNYQLLHPFGTFLFNQPPPYFSPRWLAWLYDAINKHQFRSTRLVLTPSAYVLNMHLQVGFFSSAKTQVLPSGIELPTPSQSHPSHHQPLRLVYVGALENIKGIRQLISSLKQVPAGTAELDIYGLGSLQSEISQQITGLQHVRLHGYLADKTTLRSYDVLVFPSICYETQGLVVLEALSYGLPVIASDIGGPTEVIQPGVNGWLFRAGSVEALSQAILALATDRNQLLALQSRARQSVEKYSLTEFGEHLLDVYDSILAEAPVA